MNFFSTAVFKLRDYCGNVLLAPPKARGKASPHNPRPVHTLTEFLEALRSNAFNALRTTGHEVDLDGWMDPSFASVFERNVKSITNGGVIIEVGSWKGLSATTMAAICKQHGVEATILAVDTWLGAPEFWTWGLKDPSRGDSLKRVDGYPTVFKTFTKNVKALGHDDIIVPFPISSLQAVDVMKFYGLQADIIYVDAAHEFDAVYQDIKAFWELLKPGGTMMGDDYTKEHWPGVVAAVDRFCEEVGLEKTIDGVVWSCRREARRRDRG